MITTLRTPDPAHYLELATWISNAHECLRWAGPKLRFPFEPARLAQLLEADQCEAFVLMEEDKVLGFGQLIAREAGSMHLARIIVAPSQRGAGRGKQLCQLLVEEARKQHHRCRITLRVYRDNHAAVATYRHLGFQFRPQDSDHEAPLMELRP